ncbi:MAG: VOC family protein [Woeseiaceae bacterium]
MSTENRIDYVEIPVTDLKKTRDFFSSSLGWSFQEVFSFPGGRRFDFIDPVGTVVPCGRQASKTKTERETWPY